MLVEKMAEHDVAALAAVGEDFRVGLYAWIPIVFNRLTNFGPFCPNPATD